MPLFDVYETGSAGLPVPGTRVTVAATSRDEALARDENARGYHAGNRIAKARSHANGIYAPPPDDLPFRPGVQLPPAL